MNNFDLIVDLGISYDTVSKILNEVKELGDLFRKILAKTRDVPKAVSLLKSENARKLVELGSEFLVIVEPHSGIAFGPYEQIDSKGDRSGSLCPTSSRRWLKKFVLEIAGKHKGVVIDLCDFFAYSISDGATTCLCDSCSAKLKELIDNEMANGFLEGTDVRLTADEVLDEVQSGRAVFAGITSVSSEGWEFLRIPEGSKFGEILKLRDIVDCKSIFSRCARDDNENNFRRALASLILFIRGRSKIVADCILEAFHGLDRYKAVVLEGGRRTGPLSPIPEISKYFLEAGIDVWIDKRTAEARYYNLRRSRYLIGALNETLLAAMTAIEAGYRPEKSLLKALRERWSKTIGATSNSWIITPEAARDLGIKCAVFGWPSETRDLLKFIIKLIIKDYEYLLELDEARLFFR